MNYIFIPYLNYINKMKSVPYSPFNRTYKYICLQNKLAHSKNKRKVSSSVGSNLSFLNSTEFSSHPISSNASFIKYDNKNGILKEKPRVIHKNKEYDSRIKSQIEKENERMLKKLSQTNCRVLTKKQLAESYYESQAYKEYARKYNKDGKRKDLIYFPTNSFMSVNACSEFSTSRQLCTWGRPVSARVGNNH